MYEQERIDLHLPRAWNACTPDELEAIARIFGKYVAMADKYHPFDMGMVKAELFFAFAGLSPLGPANPRKPVEQQYVTCRFNRPRWCHPLRLLRYYFSQKSKPFDLYLWQVNSFVKDNLGWLDGESALTLFPYERIRRNTTKRRLQLRRSRRFAGPDALMQDFTWQRYRIANDYMSFYIDQQNSLERMLKNPQNYSDKEIRKKEKNVDLARAMFLATIFNARVRTFSDETQKFCSTYSYQSNQHSDNAPYFRRFSDVKWQVVLFWWSGMMAYLMKKYPHCFKKQKVTGFTNPLDFYTRTVATMEKYLGLDEEKVNNQNFHLVFQHLEDMARENEELERIRRSSK